MGGQNRPVSGPDPQPKPKTSNSNVKTMTFWYTIGCVHQSPMRLSPPVGVQRDDRGAGGDVHRNLGQIEQVHRIRRSETVFYPVPCHDLQSCPAWLVNQVS